VYDCIVCNLVLFSNTDDVLRPSIEKDASNKLGMAGCDDNELKFAAVLAKQFLKLLPANQLAITLFRFKEQEVSFIFQLVISISDLFEGVLNAMA
jgi:hypothetical protein